jgi:hypothetical protein
MSQQMLGNVYLGKKERFFLNSTDERYACELWTNTQKQTPWFNPFHKRKRVSAVSHGVPLQLISNIDKIRVLVDLADQTGSPDVYNNPVVELMVMQAWQGFGSRAHTIFAALYVFFLIISTATNFGFNQWMNWTDNWRVLAWVMVGFNLLMTCLFSIIELEQFVRNMSNFRVSFYLKDVYNWIEVSAYSLTYAGNLIRIFAGAETDESRIILSVSTVLLWYNLLYYLRPIAKVGKDSLHVYT